MIQVSLPSVFNEISTFFKDMADMNFLVDQELEDDGIKLRIYTNDGNIPEEMKPKIKKPSVCKIFILSSLIIAVSICTSLLLLDKSKLLALLG